MGTIVNHIFRKAISRKFSQIDEVRTNSLELQEKLRGELLETAEKTAYGQKYHFKELKIKGADTFSRELPIVDYDTLKPYIERTLKGEQGLLWPTPVKWFAKSSGTTSDRSKFIPITKESLHDCHFEGGRMMYAIYYQMNPAAALADGNSFVLGGSHQINQYNKSVRFGDLSAVLLENLPLWAVMKRSPSLQTALMEDYEAKIEQMAREALNANVTHLLGVPTWTVVLIQKIFELSGKKDLHKIWPNLELYVHGGVSFTPYRKLFQELIPKSSMNYMETYNASEGFFAIQDDFHTKDLLLLTNLGIYYEFVPIVNGEESDACIPLSEVEAGKTYAVIISTNGGLWRYKIGDTLRFTSTSPFKVEITGRTKLFINAFGEELVIENAEKGIEKACEVCNAVVQDFTAGPIYFSDDSSGGHEWIIEFKTPPTNIEAFKDVLDRTLREVNSDYDAKRNKDMAMKEPLIHVVPEKTFYYWMKKRGKLGGQNKVPRLANHRQFIQDLQSFYQARQQN